MTIAIMGKYRGKPTEKLDTAESSEEARTLVGEYRMAFGVGWTVWAEKDEEAEA